MQLNRDEARTVQRWRKSIGTNIHQARMRRKLVMAKFSKNTGMSQQILDLYELGKGEIDLNQMVKIASALRIDVCQLLDK